MPSSDLGQFDNKKTKVSAASSLENENWNVLYTKTTTLKHFALE